ncbi:alcohol dehydrogenase [Thozetella sp. PMI_491]|nr:alcohol dehydrogenase [Thozetella sp. PMI_491]
MAQREISFQVFRGSKEGKIVTGTTTRLLGPNEALVKLHHSGVCGTDEHFLQSGCVLGHEGVGVVEEVGPQVRGLKAGDRVGFGYVHNVCGQCNYCLGGQEQICPERKMFGWADLDEGSFGSHVVWDADILARIPDGMELKHAAPLMCAGATVWTALTRYGLKTGDRVGIQGIGGLGHLAIQFAAKLGHEVVVLSSSESKREEAMKLGATEFYIMDESLTLPLEKRIDQLLVCGSGNPNYTHLINLMAPDGVIFPLTVSSELTPICLHDLVKNGLRIQGALLAARPDVRRMLSFAVQHGIKPIIMEWPMSVEGIEQAMESLRTGKVRYRAVLNVC